MLGAPYYQHHQAAVASRNAYLNAYGQPTVYSNYAPCPPFNHAPHYQPYGSYDQFDTPVPNVCQQRTLEIIKLEEVPAPVPGPSKPRRAHNSQSFASEPASSYESDSDASEDDSEEESGESYCSSDDAVEQDVNIRRASSAEDEELEPVRIDDTFSSRMRRIEAWRDGYAKAVGAELAPSPSRSTTKRKGSDDDIDDTLSRSSKRSRRSVSNAALAGSSSSSASARSAHSCSACDANFASRQSLRRHGRSPRSNEACRAAVEYGFE